MKKNNKFGFTLVELLAVIVILAIILVIAVPKVMSVIEDAKKATLESTAKMIASEAEKQKVQNTVLGKTEEITCKSVAKINDVDYESCNISFNNNKALVTIKGSNKFEGLYVCNGPKTDAVVQEDECEYLLTLNDKTIDGDNKATTTLVNGNLYKVGDTFNVTAARACVVAISYDNGSTYTKLSAVKVEEVENTYQFSIPENISSDFQILITLKGDIDSDGKVNVADVTYISRYLLTNDSHRDMTDYELFMADVNGDSLVNSDDADFIKFSILSISNENHKDLEW